MAQITTQPALKTLASGYAFIHQDIDNHYEIQVKIMVSSGLLHDTPEQRGMAHFVEHLILSRMLGPRNTTLFQDYDDTDYSFAGINGRTGPETTKYVCRFTGKDKADRARQFIEDFLWIIGKSYPTDDMIQREKARVLHEAALRRENFREHLYDMRVSLLSGDDRVEPIGTPETLGRITSQDVCAFLDAHYTPDNIVIVSVGEDIAPEKIAAFPVRTGRRADIVPAQHTEPLDIQLDKSGFHASHFLFAYRAEKHPASYYKNLLLQEMQIERKFINDPAFESIYSLPVFYFNEFLQESWVDIVGSCADRRWDNVCHKAADCLKDAVKSLDETAFMRLKEKALFFRGDYVDLDMLAGLLGHWYFRTGSLLNYDDMADDVKAITLPGFQKWTSALLARPFISLKI